MKTIRASFIILMSFLPIFAQNPDHAGNVVDLTEGIFDSRMAEIQSRSGDQILWTHVLTVPDATFVKLYFEDYHLMPGDALEIRDSLGNIRQKIMGSGPAGASEFWSLSVPGDTVILQILSSNDYIKRYAFSITKAFQGSTRLFGLPEPMESTCAGVPGASPYRSAFCYSPGQQFEDADMWRNAQATVGVLTIGSYGGGSWCSGSLVSNQDYVLTNQHCIETIADCGNTEFVFNYYRATCEENVGGDEPIITQGYYCDSTDGQTYFNNPFGSCTSAGLNDLDYAFCHILLNGPDPSPSTVYTPLDMELDHGVIENTVDMYIVGHPNGFARVISEGLLDFTGDFSLHYICETLGGSSGSPVYSKTTNKLIGLHHCGGCTTASDRNRGMFIDQIRTDIDTHGNFFAPAPSLIYESISHSDLVGGNGDGYFDPGEVIHVTAIIRNSGTLASTQGTLLISSTSPDITIPVASFDIPPLDPQVEANTTSIEFDYTIEASIACGSSYDINLVAQYDTKEASAGSSFDTGHMGNPGLPVENTATDLPKPIVSNQTTTSTLGIDIGTDRVSSVDEVQVDLTHTYIGDLLITLISPDGTAVSLHNRTGGSDDDIHLTYGDGTGGTTVPSQSLTTFEGKSATGTWTLSVADQAGGDEGSLTNWRLKLTPVEIICPALHTGFSIGTVQANFGDQISVPITLEQDLVNFEFDVIFNPGKMHFTGFTPHSSTSCSAVSVTQTQPDMLHLTASCVGQTLGSQVFLDLDFDVIGLQGDSPITADSMVGDVESFGYQPGLLDLPESVNPCDVSNLYFYQMLWSPYFDDPDLDSDNDGLLTIIDLIATMVCP